MQLRLISQSRKAVGRVMVAVLAGVLLFAVGQHRASAWGVTWSDEFTGVNDQPYSGFWTYQLGTNSSTGEIETLVNSWANSHIISDGTGTDSQALQIEAQTDSSGHWYSARISTYGKHTYGPGTYIEYRCKFPNAGQGYWPAAWAMGTANGGPGNWPANGEVDIAEEVDGQWENHQSLHMPGWDPTVVWTVNSSTTTYHNYGAWWPADSNSITFNMDGSNSATWYNGQGGTWPFTSNNQMFLLIDLAIGGGFPGNPNGSTQDNGNFDIDYVRQYN